MKLTISQVEKKFIDSTTNNDYNVLYTANEIWLNKGSILNRKQSI